MEKTRSVKEEMDGKVFFFPARVGISHSINNMTKVLFPICTLIWRVNIYVSRQGKVSIGEMKVQLLVYKLQPLSIVSLFENHFWLFEPLKLFPSDLEATIS